MLADGVYIILSSKLVMVEVITNIQYKLSTRKTPPHKRVFSRNIANIYVRIFGKYTQFCHLMYTWFL